MLLRMIRKRWGIRYFDPFEEVLSKDGNTMTLVPAQGQYLDGGFVEGWLHANNVVIGSK